METLDTNVLRRHFWAASRACDRANDRYHLTLDPKDLAWWESCVRALHVAQRYTAADTDRRLQRRAIEYREQYGMDLDLDF